MRQSDSRVIAQDSSVIPAVTIRIPMPPGAAAPAAPAQTGSSPHANSSANGRG